MMSTNIKIIELAYRKLGYGDNIEQNTTNNGLDELHLLMGDLEGQNIIIGYNFDGNMTEETGFDRQFDSAIVSVLAFRLSENLRMPTSQSLSSQMSAGMNVLYKQTLQSPTWKRPSRMPRGSGNNRYGFGFDRYYANQANSYTMEREDQYFVTLVNATTYIVDSIVRESGKHTLSFSVNGAVTDGTIESIEYLRPNEVTWNTVDDSEMELTALKSIVISDEVESYRFRLSGYSGGSFTLTVTDKVEYQAYAESPNTVDVVV